MWISRTHWMKHSGSRLGKLKLEESKDSKESKDVGCESHDAAAVAVVFFAAFNQNDGDAGIGVGVKMMIMMMENISICLLANKTDENVDLKKKSQFSWCVQWSSLQFTPVLFLAALLFFNKYSTQWCGRADELCT